MGRMRIGRIRLAVVWSNACLALVVASSVHAERGATHQPYTVSVMDLSHKSHLSAETLSEAITSTLHSCDPKEIELDVSFSELGNEGMDLILNSLRPTTNSTIVGSHKLTSRMNRLTPKGATHILDEIIGKDQVSSSNANESIPKQDDANVTTSSVIEEVTKPPSPLLVRSLDLSFNNLGSDQTDSKAFHLSLRKLVESASRCPQVLRLERCQLGPATCRAIGKGIIKRFDSTDTSATPLSLHVSGNLGIGDSGAATIAAAIRSAKSDGEKEIGEPVVFDTLDLSSCNIGDAGVEALAMALESFPGCVRRLDLSNNAISDDGAVAIANALALAGNKSVCIESLNLSNNGGLGDRGASTLATCIEAGVIRNLSLRSCKVRADGAQSIAGALVKLAKRQDESSVNIDLSGNALGVLRRKEKNGNKYSASGIKSKASATTATYMNYIGNKIRSGLKDAGLATPASGESDDEEEQLLGMSDDSEQTDASRARCGAKAFASAIVVNEHEDDFHEKSTRPSRLMCQLALRHCTLDRGGADALAAAVLESKERFGLDLIIDARMNPVLEEEMVGALRGDSPSTLEEMSDRHMMALEVLRVAERRAAEAAAAIAARAQQEAGWDAEDDFGLNLDGFGDEEEQMEDSDDYDVDGYF